MREIKLIKGEFKEKLDLMLAPGLKAGFPSPSALMRTTVLRYGGVVVWTIKRWK
ncbi:MAG: hypothetical protein IKH05_04730 [Bacteroidaceae bacterium]|jgi:hypothetical protein|nr:hypothetical protein [Bacteroidaceae bacterium]